MRFLTTITHVMIIALWASQSIFAQGVAKDGGTNLLTQLREQASTFRFATAEAETESFNFEPKALLHWSNTVRGLQEGAVFVWTAADRPVVIGTVFVSIQQGEVKRQQFAFHSLSDSSIVGENSDVRFWEPVAGLRFREFTGVVDPASTAPRRLTQMRNLARRFSTSITYPIKKAAPLRLSPQPLIRYSSASHNIVDGALFSFVFGTDPEALLIIEAAGKEAAQWRYAFARFHYWGLEAREKGNVVWSAKAVMAMEGNYFNKARHRKDVYNSFRLDRRFPGNMLSLKPSK